VFINNLLLLIGNNLTLFSLRAQKPDFFIRHGAHNCIFISTDDKYLVQFLRSRKFNVAEAFQCLERTYLAQLRFPQFFGSLDKVTMDRAKEMIKAGMLCPFSERDHNGHKFLLLTTSRWDVQKFSAHDYVRAVTYIFSVLLEEEETQICGLSYIFDYTNVCMKHFLPPADLIDFLEFTKNCASVRIKGIYFINIPSFGKFVLRLAKFALSQKLNERLFVLNHIDELKTHVNIEVLPKEYGGANKTIDDMMLDFYDLEAKYKENVDLIMNFDVDSRKIEPGKMWSKIDTTTGSFSKLEID
jgi:hypothetical protein